MSGRKGHPQEVKNRIKSLYQSNVPIPAIHQQTGVHKNTIRSIVKHLMIREEVIDTPVEVSGDYFDLNEFIKSDFTLQP